MSFALALSTSHWVDQSMSLFETLRQFLEAKRRGVTASNDIRPWKRVAIDPERNN